MRFYIFDGNIAPTPVDTVREGQNFKLVSKCNRYGLSHVKVRKIKCKRTGIHLLRLLPLHHHTDRIKPQISTIYADSSHFPGVPLKCINEAIISRK